MYLHPWKRLKGLKEIHEVLLAYHHLSHKGKLNSWQLTAAWAVAKQGYMSNAQLCL